METRQSKAPKQTKKGWNAMTYPIAEKFKNKTYIKPTVKKTEFYKGGLLAMEQRFKLSLLPFPGAFKEFSERTQDLESPFIVGIMWEYVRLE